MTIPIVHKILEKNERAAEENRVRFYAAGVTCINLLGGAGSGKTALLEALTPRLKPRARLAVLEGDLATTRDAERIAALGVPVVQLLTDGGCHLTATHVQAGLKRAEADPAAFRLADVDLLIIENVGNPICPANFDLGEHYRICVLSVAEGDDKPAKYPLLYRGAALVVLTKGDLLPHVRFDADAARRDIRRVNPSVEVLCTSARCGDGIAHLADWIIARLARRPLRPPGTSAPQSAAPAVRGGALDETEPVSSVPSLGDGSVPALASGAAPPVAPGSMACWQAGKED